METKKVAQSVDREPELGVQDRIDQILSLEDEQEKGRALAEYIGTLPVGHAAALETYRVALERLDRSYGTTEQALQAAVSHMDEDQATAALTIIGQRASAAASTESKQRYNIDKRNAGELARLAPRLPTSAFGEALDTVGSMGYGAAQSHALDSLAAYIPPEYHEQVVALANSLENTKARLSVLARYMPRLEGARARELLDQLRQAVESIDEVGSRAGARLEVAKACAEKGMRELAMEGYSLAAKEAQEASDDHVWRGAFELRADLHRQAGELTEALRDYEQSLSGDDDPGSSGPLMSSRLERLAKLGEIAIEAGRDDLAEKALLEALDLSERYGDYRNGMQVRRYLVTLFRKSERVEDAEEQEARLRELMQEHPDIAATLDAVSHWDAESSALRYARTLSDLDHANDWIGIRSDVEALSTLTAVNRIDPPLSIAIFGDWGSGKTFLMRKIQERVQILEDVGKEQQAVAKDGDVPRYCSSILQIEFNAWHYKESNLWASLVSHILEKLQQKLSLPTKGEEQKEEDIEKFFGELETARAARGVAEQRRQLIEAEVKQARKALVTVKRGTSNARTKLAAAMGRKLWSELDSKLKGADDGAQKVGRALQHFGYRDSFESAQTLYDVLTRFRSVSGRAREVFGSLLATKQGVAGAIGVAGVVAIATVAGAFFEFPSLSMGTAVAGALAWLAERARTAGKWLEDIQSADEWLSGLMQQAESEIAQEVAMRRAALEERTEALVAARSQLAEAKVREARAEADLKALTVRDEMRRFVNERVTAQTYSKHLGLISMIRRDFEDLSDFMFRERQPGEARLVRRVEKAVQDRIPTVERIILYIDDLDRCQPERVVEVLEAVHLLLAFRLFIVVLAVDPRWVLESLRVRYPHLAEKTMSSKGETLQRGGDERSQDDATAHDYLEKIFHIPFWVRPMGPKACQDLVAGYLDFPEVQEEEGRERKTQESDERYNAVAPRNSARQSSLTEQVIQAIEEDGATVPGEGPSHASNDEQRRAAQRRERERDLAHRQIEQVEITKGERDFIHQLAPHLGHSPRRIKRFANTYRLLKTGLTREERRIFEVDDGDDFKIVLVMLAVVTGAPTLAPQIFAAAFRQRQSVTVQEILAKVDFSATGAYDHEGASARGALELLGAGKISSSGIETWVPRVMRYAFRLAPVDVTASGVSDSVVEKAGGRGARRSKRPDGEE